jgi:type IV secretory pathway VirB10-like protein
MVSIDKPAAGLAILLAALALPAAAQQGNKLYCCDGGRICADSLPAQCRGKAFRILDEKGNVIKEVGPPLTADQKAQLVLEEKQRKEAEEKLKEQRRKDQALLDTYATLDDIDIAQRKAEGDVNLAIKDIEAKIEASRKKRKKFEDEAEFYKKKTLPVEVTKGLGEADHEIKTQQELLAVKRGDLQTIKTKYDTDRKRYIELTGARPRSGS